MLQTGQSHSKTQQNKKSWLFWVFVIASFPIAGLLLAYSAGYRFDPTTRSVIETSAIAIQTEPKQADVYLDSEKQSEATPFIEIVLPGEYTVRVEKNGYHQWEKTMTIAPGESLLFPDITLLADDTTAEPTTRIESTDAELRSITLDEQLVLQAQNWSDLESVHVLAENSKPFVFSAPLSNSSILVENSEDIGSQEQTVLDTAIIDAEWLDNLLLHTNGYEIATYSLDNQKSELFIRQSESISAITWHPSGSLFFYSDTTGIHAVELDGRDTRQSWTLSDNSSVTTLEVIDRNRSLYFETETEQFILPLR